MPHTPGPWNRNIPPATKYVTVWTGRNKHVFDVMPARGISAEEAEANLSLVAASPEMASALTKALEALHYSSPRADHYPEPAARHAEAYKAVREALIKAGLLPAEPANHTNGKASVQFVRSGARKRTRGCRFARRDRAERRPPNSAIRPV